MISSSPHRHTFLRDKYIKQQTEKGLMDDPETEKQLEWYTTWDRLEREKEQDPAWQKDCLEYDLRNTDWILKKVRESDTYAQSLYAAMCNNDFIKNAVWPLLKEETWSCSWRYAGGVIADMQEQGDYIDWYCSGSGWLSGPDCNQALVAEGVVTEEIREDLLKLGWLVREYNES